MEIVITKYEKVDIDPRKVVEQLYLFSNHIPDEEIYNEDYKYIKALETVLNHLK